MRRWLILFTLLVTVVLFYLFLKTPLPSPMTAHQAPADVLEVAAPPAVNEAEATPARPAETPSVAPESVTEPTTPIKPPAPTPAPPPAVAQPVIADEPTPPASPAEPTVNVDDPKEVAEASVPAPVEEPIAPPVDEISSAEPQPEPEVAEAPKPAENNAAEDAAESPTEIAAADVEPVEPPTIETPPEPAPTIARTEPEPTPEPVDQPESPAVEETPQPKIVEAPTAPAKTPQTATPQPRIVEAPPAPGETPQTPVETPTSDTPEIVSTPESPRSIDVDAEPSKDSDENLLAKLESVFASEEADTTTTAAKPRPRRPAAQSTKDADVLDPSVIDELESLFDAPPQSKPTPPTKPRSQTQPKRPRNSTSAVPARVAKKQPRKTTPAERPVRASSSPPRTPQQWQRRQHELREFARQESREKLSAVFRLEPQDPETFRRVAAAYKMDVLLATPTRGVYAIVPHDKNFLDKTQYSDNGAYLKKHYGLSVQGLDLPWLRDLRTQHVSTQLLSPEIVQVSLLIPKRQATLILGAIVAGCRTLGYALDDVQECYGTFFERWLGGRAVFEYVVTRLVLRDGQEVFATRDAGTTRAD